MSWRAKRVIAPLPAAQPRLFFRFSSALWLQQIPSIAPAILENRHPSIRLVARRLKKAHALGEKQAIIAPEIVGMKEKEHPAAGLVADPRRLPFVGRLGEKQPRAAARRRHENPAL